MKFFSTDGIRGKALDLISSNLILYLGQILGKKAKRVVIGYDPRMSSPQIVDLLINGLITQGCDVDVVGVIPTPMMSFILKEHQYDYGFVVTASHNPYDDNGIKIFDNIGEKISSDEIDYIKKELEEKKKFSFALKLGSLNYVDYLDSYLNYLQSLLTFKNHFRILLDLSNGAFSFLHNRLEIENVTYQSYLPDGKNINHQVGSLYPENLQKIVREENYDFGFAFDGDGDRLVMVTSNQVFDGDDLLYLLINHHHFKNVVLTKASNQGIIDYLETNHIKYNITDVGDQNVLEKLKKENSEIGCEPSGHLIFKNHYYSDSFYSFVEILKVINSCKLPSFEKYLCIKKDIYFDERLYQKKNEIESYLDSVLTKNDYLLIRESGTQDILRINIQTKSIQKYQLINDYFNGLENK